MRNSKGYTLVELIVVMGIFIGIIIMTSSAFEKILKATSQQTKSAESQIEGIVGLELLRYDIEHAGYGLAWTYPTGVAFTFSEAGSTPPAGTAVDATAFGAFNEIVPPRAFIGAKTGTGATNPGSSYLVIKSVVAPLGQSARRWSYVNYSSNNAVSPPANLSYVKKWQKIGFADNDVQQNDRVITLNTTFTGTAGTVGRTLVTSGTTFFYPIGSGGSDTTAIANPAFKPPESTQTYSVYALGQNDPVMPYNRADFYVKRPTANMPSSCNSGTGILYKAAVENNSGRLKYYTEYPILDCVGDMQVVFQLDMDGDGIGGTYASTDGTLLGTNVEGSEGTDQNAVFNALGSAGSLRSQMKQVMVYILTHEGGKDTSFTYPVADPSAAVVVADRTYRREGRVWSASDMQNKFGPDWRNYRWKVYTLVIRPKNLN
jgi:type II secretory pathway pseudopilin PulG